MKRIIVLKQASNGLPAGQELEFTRSEGHIYGRVSKQDQFVPVDTSNIQRLLIEAGTQKEVLDYLIKVKPLINKQWNQQQ